MEKIIKESNLVQIKLVDGDFVESFKDNKNPSLYLSKNMKFFKIDNENNINDYAVIRDNKFKSICNEFYTTIWEKDNSIIIKDKEEILDKLKKNLAYASIINSDNNFIGIIQIKLNYLKIPIFSKKTSLTISVKK